MKSFSYALVKLVPRIERDECVNVGVILYCQALDFLDVGLHVDEARLLALDPAVDIDGVRGALDAYRSGCTSGPSAELDLGKRFGWLTAPRSTILRTGPVHTGLTADPAADLARLVTRLVEI
ncbi:DUF3037 domain-containing protein [Longispora albida]|uniref:DUF3037 domain-containing protein n=1 Tax=Longispora albida TaxID=203523 RepID=UPI0003703A7C|nr:DUF3037 domain-containing protein [Longispora albida]